MAIAKDILAQIKKDLYNIESGTWVQVSGCEHISYGQKELLGEFDESPVCTVCGIGAACVSAIRLFNRDVIYYGEIVNYDDALEIIGRYFTLKQADLIEAAFEQRTDTDDMHVSANQEELEAAMAFGSQISNHTDLAIAIFKNIIKNKGTFRPKQKAKV